MSQKITTTLLIAFLVFAVAAGAYALGAFTKAELFVYDAQAKLLRANQPVHPSVKVILVDEAALKSMSEVAGRWPWSRAIWSDLLDYLELGGARAALFDILFLEPQNQANDDALVSASKNFGRAYHSMLIMREALETQGQSAYYARPLPSGVTERFSLKNVAGAQRIPPGTENNDFSLPISGLAEASKGLAVVEFTPDRDNGYRRTQPLREYQGQYFSVLGLAPFVDASSRINFSGDTLQLNDREIPLDSSGNSLINMYGLGKVETFSISGVFASLQQIRKGEVENLIINPEVFKDSIVFIGTSAIGTADLKSIPMGTNVPGVMLHAFFANNYLLNDFMRPPAKNITYLFIFIGVFFTAWAVMFFEQFWGRIVLPTGMILAYIGLALVSFKFNTQMEIVPFLFASFSSGFLSFGYLTITEDAERRKVAHLFEQYVSKEVLDEVLHHYEEYAKSSVGQKVEITVLFSDIRGFTTISETTPPERVVEMLNVHFTVMANIILKHNGTIDKYIGDAIMAFWGAPVKTDDHAERAVLAGQEMLEGLKEVNRILKERGFEHEVKIGVGINTGEATIGSIGSEQKKNYTVVGDSVNLSSRLESITKEQKVPLLFSEYTYEKVKSKLDCRLVGNVTVKGREQAVNIYTLK